MCIQTNRFHSYHHIRVDENVFCTSSLVSFVKYIQYETSILRVNMSCAGINIFNGLNIFIFRTHKYRVYVSI